MADNTSQALGFLEELFKTPNGQIRLLGAVMCVGPGYYLLNNKETATTFTYVMIGVGTMFILLSAGMAIWAAMHQEPAHDQRRVAREEFPASDRLRDFSSQVLGVTRTRQEITEMTFGGYDKLKKEQLYAILMQATANECVMAGVASRINRQYLDIQVSDATIIIQPGDGNA
jgi:hypothetical protein